MRNWIKITVCSSWLLIISLTQGCQLTPVDTPERATTATRVIQIVYTPTPLVMDQQVTATATEAPQVAASETQLPAPSSTPTETLVPAGFGIVPELRGLPLSEARLVVVEAGFSFLFQDILDPEVPTGTIVDQDPPAGIALPVDEIIFLYRSFQALEMIAGGSCQPLNILFPSGKLLYWVALDEGVRYEIRTDFPYGRTQISDYRMYLMGEFDNSIRDSMEFKPLAPGRYVISLGPYEVSKARLENEGSLSAGCLWITPGDQD